MKNTTQKQLHEVGQHVFRLRLNPPFDVKVPADLTTLEAERIIKWINAITVD